MLGGRGQRISIVVISNRVHCKDMEISYLEIDILVFYWLNVIQFDFVGMKQIMVSVFYPFELLTNWKLLPIIQNSFWYYYIAMREL